MNENLEEEEKFVFKDAENDLYSAGVLFMAKQWPSRYVLRPLVQLEHYSMLFSNEMEDGK